MKKWLVAMSCLFVCFASAQGVESYEEETEEIANDVQVLGYDNFGIVDPGKLYRSAQLTAGDLDAFTTKYGFKTVINLRGESDEEWFRLEKIVAKHRGLKLINIGMSASIIPHRDNLIKLLEAYKNSPRPILIHCLAGADRTGEAAALYQMLYMGKTKEQAIKMLSARHGHLESFKPAKKYFIREVWQGLEWAYNEYNPCSGKYKYYNINSDQCSAE